MCLTGRTAVRIVGVSFILFLLCHLRLSASAAGDLTGAASGAAGAAAAAEVIAVEGDVDDFGCDVPLC